MTSNELIKSVKRICIQLGKSLDFYEQTSEEAGYFWPSSDLERHIFNLYQSGIMALLDGKLYKIRILHFEGPQVYLIIEQEQGYDQRLVSPHVLSMVILEKDFETLLNSIFDEGMPDDTERN